jgi:ATP-binding cassette, subfamily B, bacterial
MSAVVKPPRVQIPVRQYFKLLEQYLRPQRTSVVLMAVCLLSSVGLQLFNPQIVRFFMDTAQKGGAQSDLIKASAVFIGASFFQQVLNVAATYFSTRVGWTATNELRANLAEHCLKLDLSFHKAHTPGELIERVDGDVSTLAAFFSNLSIHLGGNLLLLLGVLVVMFLEDWRIGASLTVFSVVAMLALGRVRNLGTPYWKAVREQNASFFGFLGEQLSGTEDIRSSGATQYVMRGFFERLRSWYPMVWHGNMLGGSMWVVFEMLLAVGVALAFGVGANLYQHKVISLGTVYLIYQYTRLLAEPLDQIRNQLQELQRADAGISRVNELINTQSKLMDGAGANWSEHALEVEFRAVHFGYEPDTKLEKPDLDVQPNLEVVENVLENISFKLSPGKILGLLGRTGSGKTTLARLLMRFYDPQQGEIRLGGVPLKHAKLEEVRSRVTLVTQNVELFQASLRDNLSFFDPNVNDKMLWAALEELGLSDWVKKLPKQLDTELSSANLSAGEAQLLAFTRVFLCNPSLIILDEASSRLDPATEALLERAVTKLLAGRTAIIIAHRLQTILRADEILILEDGKILEHGATQTLANNPNSRFAQLRHTGLEEVLA